MNKYLCGLLTVAVLTGGVALWSRPRCWLEHRAVGFLPPFSPELNPVERLVEEVRRQVEGRVYETLQDKVEAVERFLKALAQDTERLHRLIGWQWIIQAGQDLQKPAPLDANQAATS